ncbi:MAG: hypothetical protein ACK4MV_07940 [Beijerinckiaceae bacterium]
MFISSLPSFRFWLLALGIFLCASFIASAQTPVAIVNGRSITVDDLSVALSDLANQGVPQSELLERVPSALRDLMVERLVEEAYAKGSVTTSKGEETSTDFVMRRAERARRRLLVDTYMRAKLVPPSVSQEDVDAYVRDNPDYFRARKTWHFSELSISPPTENLKNRLLEEMKDVAGQRAIRPQRIEVLIDWLSANKFGYSHSKQWRGSEQVPRSFLDRLKQLDGQATKLSVAEAGGLVNVAVLYGSYDDPANPAHMQQTIISQVLARQAREDQIKAIGDNLIANAKVQIFEENMREALLRPGARGLQTQFATPRQKTLWTIELALLFLAPFAAWTFFRRDPAAAGLTKQDTALRHFSHGLEARLVVAGGIVAFALAGAAYALHASGALSFTRDLMIAALAAMLITVALVVMFWKVPALARILDNRWAPVGAVAAAQAIVLAVT